MILKGTISTYPDGSINPKVAAREYINHTDPNRVKVSVFKFLTDDVSTLKKTIETLNAKIEEQKNYVSDLLEAVRIMILTIQDGVEDGELDYLNSLSDLTAIENELTNIMNLD